VSQHQNNVLTPENPPQNTGTTHQHNKTKPPKRHRTKPEIDALMNVCWENHTNTIPINETIQQYNISQAYYYRLLQRAATKLKKEFGEKIDLTMMRVINQYLRNHRLTLTHYAQEIKSKKETTDFNEKQAYDSNARAWLIEARNNQHELACFLIKTGLIREAPKELKVSVQQEFEDELQKYYDEKGKLVATTKRDKNDS